MLRKQPDWYFLSDSRAWTSSAMLMVDLCSCNCGLSFKQHTG